MTAPSGSSSPEGSSSRRDGKGQKQSSSISLHDSRWRFLPLVWQVGGGLISIGGFWAGHNSLADVGAHLAVLGFLTGVYLSLFIRERRPQDLMAIGGYFLYSAGFALISVPNWHTLGMWTPTAYALGALCLMLLLPLTWLLFIEYLAV